jgi:hypothetical protein
MLKALQYQAGELGDFLGDLQSERVSGSCLYRYNL